MFFKINERISNSEEQQQDEISFENKNKNNNKNNNITQHDSITVDDENSDETRSFLPTNNPNNMTSPKYYKESPTSKRLSVLQVCRVSFL